MLYQVLNKKKPIQQGGGDAVATDNSRPQKGGNTVIIGKDWSGNGWGIQL